MSNGDVSSLLGVAAAILKDVAASYPEDTEWWSRDKQRLSHLVETRGLGVFLLDFPAIGKWLERALDSGRLIPSPLPCNTGRWPGSPIPRLFSGLWSRVFHKNGTLRDDADVNAIMFLRQIFLFAKGYKHDCSSSRWHQAVDEFYICERELPSASLLWQADDIDVSGLRNFHFCDAFGDQTLYEHDANRTQECSSVRSRLNYIQTCFDYVVAGWKGFDPLAYTPRHGPGAVSDLPGGVSKYSFPTWPERLEREFPFADLAIPNYGFLADIPDDANIASSALIGVPKTAKGPRLIASEPTSHQWCQQIVAGYLSEVMSSTNLRFAVDLRNQQHSRDAVLQASHTMTSATIDLSAASDRISCALVERAFRTRGDLLRVFHAVRTPTIQNRTGYGSRLPEKLELKKFSTMGSALTFPIQSILFAVITASTVLFEEGRPAREILQPDVWKRVRVFGDDIICPRHVFGSVKTSLELFALRVNPDKSFGNGKFLESCGMDAFDGVDVTPAKINRLVDAASPESIRSVVDSMNHFFKKGFWATSEHLKSTLPSWVRKYLDVVSVDSGLVGMSSFCGSQMARTNVRYNRGLQREERRVLNLRTTVAYSSQPGEHTLMQRFIEKPRPDTIWSAGRVKSVSQYLTLGWAPTNILSSDWTP